MKRAIIAIAVMITFLPSSDVLAQISSTTPREQTSFCEGDNPLLKPTRLPSAVVTTLMASTEGKEVRELATNEGEELDPLPLFKGARAHLSNSRDLFYVVIGSSPMSGADNTWFWIVQLSGKRARILLFAGANCMDITRRRTRGFKDIVTTWASASETLTETYQYDGSSYKLRQKKRGSPPE